MRKSIVLLLFLLMGLCVVEVKTVSAVAEDSWMSVTPMPTARSMLGVAVVDGKIYAIGGISGTQNILGTNEVYDPETNTWSSKTPMPTHRCSFGIAVVQNKIYCIGGATTIKSDGYVTNVNEVYDPSTDTWENRTSMPNPRSHLEANTGRQVIFAVLLTISVLVGTQVIGVASANPFGLAKQMDAPSDAKPPIISISSPQNSTDYSGTFNISFSVKQPQYFKSTVIANIWYTIDNTTVSIPYEHWTLTQGPSISQYSTSITAPTLPEGNHSLKIRAQGGSYDFNNFFPN